VVKSSWIIDCYRKGVRLPDSDYRLPAFKGLRVCISGLEPLEAREKAREIVEKYEGVFSSDLTMQCTHLVCDPQKVATNLQSKYHWANLWNIHIVTFEWLSESIRIGGMQNSF